MIRAYSLYGRVSFLIVLIGLSLLISPRILAQRMVCAGCGKPITSGEWIQAEGKVWHPQHFVCANCKKPIGKNEYFQKDGKLYDRECFEEVFSPRCAFCGRALTGTFTTYDGKSYHSECFLDHVAPKCGVCGKPLDGKYVTYEGRTYHESCYEQHVAITCTYCGGLIEGKYLKDYWGDNYHEVHKGKVKECDFCQRLITPELYKGSKEWSDGRILCGLCAPSAVTSPETAESILVVVAVKLRMLGIDVDPADVRVSLVDQKELANLTNSREKTIKGFTSYREGTALWGLIKNRKMDVYLLFGMPRIQTMYAAAHELMHVWQFLAGKTNNDRALCEGSCNYAAYLVLRDMSAIEAKYLTDKMAEDPDPNYGDGYRKVKSFVEENGITAWLDWLRENSRAPW